MKVNLISIMRAGAEALAECRAPEGGAYNREQAADAGMGLLDAPQTTNVTRMRRKE